MLSYKIIQISNRLEAATGEANEVGANTEASALASRGADRGRDNVKDREDGRGDNAERHDLIPGERATGNKDSRNSDKETLDEILNHAIDDFRRGVHAVYIPIVDFSSEQI
jgi:hypothetical protein